MTNENGYNGWTNWETWNFMLWYQDDMQASLEDFADEENDIDYSFVYTFVEGFLDQLLEVQEQESGFFNDAVGMAVQKLNLHEMAEHLLEGIE